jgi:hypothetical protein
MLENGVRLERFWYEELERVKDGLLAGRREPPDDIELPATFWAGTWEDIVVENYLAEHLLARFAKSSTVNGALRVADLEHVLGFHEGSPENLSDQGRLHRYRTYGDLITFFHGYFGNDKPVETISIIPSFREHKRLSMVDNARYYYEAAGLLGAALRKLPEDNAFVRLADVLPAYAVILRGLPK